MQKIYKHQIYNLIEEDLYSDDEMRKIFFLIARALNSERLRKSISVTELERLTGIDRGSIYRIEGGKRKITLEYLIKICHALGINLDDAYHIFPMEGNDNDELKELFKTLNSKEKEKVAEYIRELKK